MSEEGHWRQLCEMESLPDRGCREFRYGRDDEVNRGFLVRLGDALYAYRNSCPHLQISLNWLPHHFLDERRVHIQCALHGALFDITTGECIRGPCFGRFLDSIPLQVADGWVRIPDLVDGEPGDSLREVQPADG